MGEITREMFGDYRQRMDKRAFRPIWSDGYVYRNERMVGTDAEIDTGLWMGILGGIAFVSLAGALIVNASSRKESESPATS